ncbi:MAG: hypothetical protein RR452_10605, partial [Clostridia bacterium]
GLFASNLIIAARTSLAYQINICLYPINPFFIVGNVGSLRAAEIQEMNYFEMDISKRATQKHCVAR